MHLIVLFVGFSFTLCSAAFVRRYHFFDQKLNWAEARLFCRDSFADLATFRSTDDFLGLLLPVSQAEYVWIGLNDDPKSWKRVLNKESNSWRWSATGESVPSYQNWRMGEPDNDGASQYCVTSTATGWTDKDCELKMYFVCFDGPVDQKTYHLVKTEMTWKEARDYCRMHHTDLAVIDNLRDNAKILFSGGFFEVWVGLYRVPWKWSDGSTSSFSNWRDGQPNNYGHDQHCGAIRRSYVWDDINCDLRHPFLCYDDVEVTKVKVLRVTFETTRDISDPQSRSILLQKLEDELWTSTQWIRISLRWKIGPHKQETKEGYREDCMKVFP